VEHITVKAVVVDTDEGTFSAVISSAAVDRERDIVMADAMVKALHGWERPIPLAWNHSTKAEDIIGALRGASARVEDGEVIAFGDVDLDTARGREAWRLMKKRIVGFSFGYMTTAQVKRADGGRTITALDVFEISVTPTPMNNDTRVLSVKGLGPDHDVGVKARDLRLRALLATPKREPEPAVKAAKPIKVASFDA
jgi:HK97 family phage prohead protease